MGLRMTCILLCVSHKVTGLVPEKRSGDTWSRLRHYTCRHELVGETELVIALPFTLVTVLIYRETQLSARFELLTALFVGGAVVIVGDSILLNFILSGVVLDWLASSQNQQKGNRASKRSSRFGKSALSITWSMVASASILGVPVPGPRAG